MLSLARNGNEALHTAAFYTNGYVRDVTIQATLDNPTSTNNWPMLLLLH